MWAGASCPSGTADSDPRGVRWILPRCIPHAYARMESGGNMRFVIVFIGLTVLLTAPALAGIVTRHVATDAEMLAYIQNLAVVAEGDP